MALTPTAPENAHRSGIAALQTRPDVPRDAPIHRISPVHDTCETRSRIGSPFDLSQFCDCTSVSSPQGRDRTSRNVPDRAASGCMHVQARLVGSPCRIRHPETRRRNRPAPPDRTCFAGPGAHCTAPKSSQVPKILTLSTACPFVSMPPNVRHTRDWLPGRPENAHLIEKMRHSNGHGNDSRKTSP